MDSLSAATLPWLDASRERLRDARQAGRLPHSTLLVSPPGLGAELFANWMAGLALCESQTPDPCGACASCMLLKSDSHPDYHVVRVEEDAKQIKVDQVRDLIGALDLKSYRGGYKVGVIEGAETLNANGANAFLKTLEEPSADTLLVLVARPAHRLPATIASRCLRASLRPPSLEDARRWLKQRTGQADADWDGVLELAGGAPLMALDLGVAGMAALDEDMRRSLRALGADAVDVTLVADHWIKSDLALRLLWLENWVTRRVRKALGERNSLESAEPVRLPAALLKPKIRALFDLLDGARELRRLSGTGVNQQLALEALLLGGGTALAN